MPTLDEDLVNGHQYEEVLGQYVVTRVFRVSDLTAAPEGQIFEAVRFAGVPVIGEPYPGETFLTVTNVTARPDGCNACRVFVEYRWQQVGGTWNSSLPTGRDGTDVKSVSAGLATIKRPTDYNGDPMILSPPSRLGTSDALKQQSEANYQIPVASIRFERYESQPLTDRARNVLGKLNSPFIGSYTEFSLLCTRIDSNSTDGGRNWRCVYEFQYRSDGWDHYDVWKASNGKPPNDATVQAFRIYQATDFGVLGLDFTDSQTPV